MKVPFEESVRACKTGRDEVRQHYEIDYDNLKLRHKKHYIEQILEDEYEDLLAGFKSISERQLWANHISQHEEMVIREQYERKRRRVIIPKPISWRIDDPIDVSVPYEERWETFEEFRDREGWKR